MGKQASYNKKQKKIQNNKKDKYNVHLRKMRQGKIQAGQKK